MPGYRLYLMTDDGHIDRPVEFICDDDIQALVRADEERNGRPAELWSGARVVAKLAKVPDA